MYSDVQKCWATPSILYTSTGKLATGDFLKSVQTLIETQFNTEGSDASLRSCARPLLDLFLFLKDITFRYCSSVADSFVFFKGCTSFFVFYLFSFLRLFKDTLHTVLSHDKFSVSSSLEITSLVHKYYLKFVKLPDLWNLLQMQLKRWESMKHFQQGASNKVPKDTV